MLQGVPHVSTPTRLVMSLQGIIQLGIVFMQMAPIAFSLAGEALLQRRTSSADAPSLANRPRHACGFL